MTDKRILELACEHFVVTTEGAFGANSQTQVLNFAHALLAEAFLTMFINAGNLPTREVDIEVLG